MPLVKLFTHVAAAAGTAIAGYVFFDRRLESAAKRAQAEISARVQGTIRGLLTTIALNALAIMLLYVGWFWSELGYRVAVAAVWTIPNAIAFSRALGQLKGGLGRKWSGEVGRRAVQMWVADNRGTYRLLVASTLMWLASWLFCGGYAIAVIAGAA